jgi:hypothetical protein
MKVYQSEERIRCSIKSKGLAKWNLCESLITMHLCTYAHPYIASKIDNIWQAVNF